MTKLLSEALIIGALIPIIVSLAGCATANFVRAQNRQRLQQIEIGMTRKQVLTIMGTETIQTFDNSGWSWLIMVPAFPAEKINNPYTSEIIQKQNYIWEIIYYYTDKKRANGAITDDELTPIIFQNGKLIGWGWRFLEDAEAKYEIRFR